MSQQSIISRGPAFVFSPLDERLEFFSGGCIHWWGFIVFQCFFIDPIRSLNRSERASVFPVFKVAPIGQEWVVERSFVSSLGVFTAKKMAPRPDFLDRFDGQVLIANANWLMVVRHLLQHLTVNHELLKTGT